MDEFIDKHYWENLNKLFSGFCHNLNNPLGAALGYLELEMMENPSDRLKKVFNQLIDIENKIDSTMKRSVCSGENRVEESVDLANIIINELNFFSNNLKFKYNLKKKFNSKTKKTIVKIDKCKFRKIVDLIIWEILKKIKDNKCELTVDCKDNIISIKWSIDFVFNEALVSNIRLILEPDNIDIKVDKNFFKFIIKNAK